MVGITNFAGPCVCEQWSEERKRGVETMLSHSVPKRAIAGRYGLTRRDLLQHDRQCMKTKGEQGGDG